MTLKDFLDQVDGVYKSIDLRIAAVKADDAWRNALTVVRFSYEEPKDLREQQKELLSRWLNIPTSHFTIEMQAWTFEMLEILCSQFLNEGKLRLLYDISGKTQEMQLGRGIDLLSVEGLFEKYGYTRREAYSWPCFEGFVGEHSPLLQEEELQRKVKSQTIYDVYTLICELLEVNFSPSLSFDLIVATPFYAFIEHVGFAEQRCKIRVRFHEDIKALAVSAVVRRGDSENAPVTAKASSTLSAAESEESGEYMRLWTREVEMFNATPADYLSVNLMQTEPTALDIDAKREHISRLLELKKPAKDPLLAAFRLFCSEGELEDYLTKPGKIQPPSPKGPGSAFEGIVSWVLALCGFRSIWLGWTEHETLKEGKIEHLRLDILAYYETKNTLLLVACTTGRPDQDIDIVNSIRRKLYEELFKDTSIQIRGFIFSSQPSVEVAKQLGEKAGVTVFGADDVRGILNYIRQGDVARSLSDYFSFPFKPKTEV